MRIPILIGGLLLGVLGAPLAARAQRQSDDERPKGRTTRSTEIRRAPGLLQRSWGVTRPGGASVQRQIEATRGGGSRAVGATTRVTGPLGNSVERRVSVERGPGGIERQLAVTGPRGNTIERRVAIGGGYGPGPGRPLAAARAPGPMAYGPIWGYGPPRHESHTSFGFFFGAEAPPPPVVVAPAPVVVAPPVVLAEPAPVVVAPPAILAAPVAEPEPNVVVREPERYRQEAPPPTIEVDPVLEEVKRLSSGHDDSREDASVKLGRLGDARAVPYLMERLRSDRDPDVRRAAAWALGEIGDPRAAHYLRQATVYDKKRIVRDEAARAITRLEPPRVDPAPDTSADPAPEPVPTRATAGGQGPEMPPPVPDTPPDGLFGVIPAPPSPGVAPAEPGRGPGGGLPDPLVDPLPPVEGPASEPAR